ncbi:ABC transporter permease [Alkalibacillus haloalkaliphilus]|uniref:ABC transporter permease n=1 Tax=Alkalibacillus haloalkaliphilus TaxID=94136 RepID=UPI0029363B38|nr:ABC transporter permease [Alkalibacillus haloalkaliphilus]MDV2583453.1 ABC transporter permease [Alkalibacillus haloalkaliphilus]
MHKFIMFEMKKATKSAFFYILLALLVLVVSGYFIYNYIQTERVEDLIEEAETKVSAYERRLEERGFEKGSDINDVKDPLEAREIEINLKFIERNETRLQGYENHDWKKVVGEEIKILEYYFERFPTQAEEQVYTWLTHFSREVNLERNRWLRDREIRPVFPIHEGTELTVYDEVFDSEIDEEAAHMASNIHSSSGFYFLYRLFEMLLTVFGAAFFLFLFGNVMTREGLGQNGPIHFLYTQPIRRGTVFVSKVITIALVSLLTVLGVVVFSLLLGTVFDRLGAWDYPVLIYEPEFQFSFMPMGAFLLWSALLFLMVLVFCYAWLFLFSVLARRTSIAIGLTLAVVFLGVQFNDQIIGAYNPFLYFDVYEIITLETALVQENFDINLVNGVLSLGVSSLLILSLSYFILRVRMR